VAEPDLARWAQHLERVQRSESALTSEIVLARSDGSTFPAAITSAARRSASGGGRSTVLSSFVDATSGKQAEAELSRSREELRALAARLQGAREEEKARIARDLHDDLGQLLTGLQLELLALEGIVEELEPDARTGKLLDHVVEASSMAGTTLETLRRISQDLHPVVLEHLGLAAAIRQELRRFENRTGTAVELRLEADPPAGDPVGPALFRICEEALTNVVRHARASHVEVHLLEREGTLVLEVKDDGLGLPPVPAAVTSSLGLLGMRERARAFGGDVTFAPGPAGGTVVRAHVRWQGAEAALQRSR
jgi:signal transduction histidine kinase